MKEAKDYLFKETRLQWAVIRRVSRDGEEA